MKKRLEKKAEKMRRKKIHEILEIVLEINGTHSRQEALTGNKPTASFEFSGHIASVMVLICKNGWQERRGFDLLSVGYMDTKGPGNSIENVEKRLNEITEELRHAGKM